MTNFGNSLLTVKRIIAATAVAVMMLNATALAQTSLYHSMTLAGNFQGWNPGANNMRLVSNNTWEITLFLAATVETNEFKFVSNGSFDSADWGKIGSPNYTTPVFGVTADLETPNNIRLHRVREGIHRFRFNNSTREFWIDRIGDIPEGTNLLKNAGFELPGSSEFDALHWKRGFPDIHGDQYGNSFRAGWRSHEGSWMAAIGAVPDNWGGMYQEVPFGSEYDYAFEGYFNRDPAWTAVVQEVKVEFFNNAFNQLGSAILPLTGITSSGIFTPRSFPASAPAGSTWARTVINVSGAGNSGTLEFDALNVRAFSRPSQSFNSWDFAHYTGNHSRGGWHITNGRTTTNGAYTFRSAVLTNPSGTLTNTSRIFSGKLTNGIGTLSFWYRHGNNNEDVTPTNPVSFIVELSPDGISYAEVGSRSGILNDFFQQFIAEYNESNQRYVRITHIGGTNDLVLDDIAITISSPVSVLMNFDNWPDSGTNYGCHTHSGWSVCTGRITTISAFQGKSAQLAPPSATFTNTITSPLFSNGIGTVTFRYARGDNGNGPAQFAVMRSTDNINWQTIDFFDQVTSPGYQIYSKSFFFDEPSYLRIGNIFNTNSGVTGGMLILSEGFNDATNTPGWFFNLASTPTYTSAGNFGEQSPSMRFDNTGETIISPEFPSGITTGLAFWAKGQTINGASYLSISGRVVNAGVTNWTLIANLHGLTNILNSGGNYGITVPLPLNISQLRFTYIKSGGNLSFDDVQITGIADSSSPPQSLRIDEIFVQEPIEFRNQNFETWPTRATFGEYEHQGWFAGGRTIINSDNAFEGQAVRLDNRSPQNAQPYIQSPLLSAGIGSVTFKYRNWQTSPSPAQVLHTAVQLSSNGTDWVTVDSLSMTTGVYQTYSRLLNATNMYAVRIQITNGNERGMVDDIEISKPQPPATLTINAFNTPSAPFIEDSVHLIANVSPSFGANNIQLTAFYRIGTSGVFSIIPMAITNFIQYGTTTPIPPQPTNTLVQYYIRAAFSGPGSENTSPIFFPPGGSNAPAFYGIPRIKPGSVWINEVRYNDVWEEFFGLEFRLVELAGKAGTDMTGWSIDFIKLGSNGVAPIAAFLITNNVVIQNQNNGFGFWVLGDETTVSRSQTITNQLYETPPIGIRLLNEMKGVESAVSFEGFIPGYERVNLQDTGLLGDTSISLTGTGTTYSAFTWVVTNTTAGAINMNQVFGETGNGPLLDPPDIFRMIISNSTIYVWSVDNTNNWAVAPYYTTSLNVNPQNWQAVTPFNSSFGGGTNTVWFTIPTNVNVIYRLRFSE